MRVTDQQSVRRVQFTRQEKALRSIPPQVQGCQDSDHHLHVLHSLYFYHGYNMGCCSLMNVCSSEVDKLLLLRNWSISNKTENWRFYFLRIIVSSKFWRGFPASIYHSQGAHTLHTASQYDIKFRTRKNIAVQRMIQNKSFTFLQIQINSASVRK